MFVRFIASLMLLLVLAGPVSAQSPLCLIGCANAEVNTKDFITASQNLVKAAEQIARFDPLGIKLLLEKNQDLQKAYASVASRLSGFTVGEPVIVLAGQLLKFRVAQASGTFRVSVWVDNRDNGTIVARRPIPDKAYRLQLPSGDDVIRPTIDTFRRIPGFGGANADSIDIKLAGARNLINQQNKLVHEKFAEFLANTYPVPIPAVADIDLNQILNTTGTHRLFIEVTPVKPNAQKRWSIEGQLIIARPGASDLLPMVFVFDSDDPACAKHQMDTQLPPQILRFTVK